MQGGDRYTGPAPPCPGCGHPMKLRNGKRGAFWGCQHYPVCDGTRDSLPDGTPVNWYPYVRPRFEFEINWDERKELLVRAETDLLLEKALNYLAELDMALMALEMTGIDAPTAKSEQPATTTRRHEGHAPSARGHLTGFMTGDGFLDQGAQNMDDVEARLSLINQQRQQQQAPIKQQASNPENSAIAEKAMRIMRERKQRKDGE